MTGKENIRISKVVKDFNIGMGTLVEFLKKKGFEIEATPNAKISPEAFDLVAKEFGKEQIIKEQSKKVAIKIKEITEKETKKDNLEEEHVQEVLIKSNTVSAPVITPAPKEKEVEVIKEVEVEKIVEVEKKQDIKEKRCIESESKEEMEEIYRTGRGGFKVRAKYTYDKANNCIDITEIPPTTTAEAIIDKIIEKVKANAIREISDIRDETDKKGLKITIDLKRGTDADKLMQKLYKMTPLEDTFSCNFNVLIAGVPQVLGVADLLLEWIAFRTECVNRRVYFDLTKAKDKLHLLLGLQKILLDIDKAIKIVRETEEEAEVVPNLMIGFGIDQIQAEYVAEIKLRHLNREYILKRLNDVEDLKKQIEDMEDILSSKARVKRIIVDELKAIVDKYGKDRRSEIIYSQEVEEEKEESEEIPDYPVTLFFTKEGYFKKITPLSLRMSGEHKLKENDKIISTVETTNSTELLFFTNKCQVYKSRASEFDDTKASVLGDYVATKLQMEPDETAISMVVLKEYKGYMLFFFQNGKVAKVDIASYETKQNRKKLIKAYSDKSSLAAIMHIDSDKELVIASSAGRHLLINTAVILPKTTKDTIGVGVLTLKKGQRLLTARDYREGEFAKPYRYKAKNLPAAGALLSAEDEGEQISLFGE